MNEPEKITIIEGPSPEFRVATQPWNVSIFQGNIKREIGWLELRTGNGEDIRQRCLRAWDEGRMVQLDYPDEMRLRQTINVVAIRLNEVDEGTVLNIWVHLPEKENENEGVFGDDDDDGLIF